MPNLIITNACNLRCPFCFASEYRAGETGSDVANMSLQEYRAQLDFAGVDSVRLCGGEPTLHPDFLEMVDLALARRGRQVFVMTNGLWPDPVRRALGALSTRRGRRISYLVNVLEPEFCGDGQWRQLQATLEALPADRVTLGITIHQAPCELDHLFELAANHGIERLRYSVAAPNLSDPRSWRVDPERDFGPMAGVVFELVMEARTRGLRVQSDCGYIPPCRFTEAQLAELRRDGAHESTPEFRCHGPIDIGAGGEAWRCFGLYAAVRADCNEFGDCSELDQHFDRLTAQRDQLLLFDECEDCELPGRGECGGGCHAYRAVRALRSRAAACQVSVDDDSQLMRATPAVDPQRLRPLRRAGAEIPMLREGGEWVELRPDPLEALLLDASDGVRSLAEIADELAQRPEVPCSAEAVAKAARRLFARGAISLRDGDLRSC